MDNSDSTIVNGFAKIDSADIADMTHITFDQANNMRALFKTISRLSEDAEIKSLCSMGVEQADFQANEIDVLRERAAKAGLVAYQA